MRHMKHAPPRTVVALSFLNPAQSRVQGAIHPFWIAKGRDWITNDQVRRAMRAMAEKGWLEAVSLQDLMGDDPMSMSDKGGAPPETAYRMTPQGVPELKKLAEEWKALPDDV